MAKNTFPIPPFKLADELFHIGSEKGPSHLLVTNDGLVLIDTGYPEDYELLINNIRALGKDPMDIKHIIHSHGHIDHFGSTSRLVQLTGAKTYIGKGDEDAVCGKNDLHYAFDMGREFCEAFSADVIINDGDVIDFGGTKIRFLITPGHTVGTLSMFFDVHWGGKTYRAGMFGGAGLNSIQKDYLDKHSLPYNLRRMYVNSIDRIITEPVQLHVGNHINDNGGRQKRTLISENVNPFLEDETYVQFLSLRRQMALELIEKEGG